MQGMLSMLLFAGALHVDLKQLKIYRWPVAALAVLGTTLSTLAVGFGMWFALPLLGLHLPLIYCLLFGALISPTDPIAVMGILKSADAPKELELVIAGESLFNDGVGVVIFSLLLDMLASGITPTAVRAAIVAARRRRRLAVRPGAGLCDVSLVEERGRLRSRGSADAGRRDGRLRCWPASFTCRGRWRWSWSA